MKSKAPFKVSDKVVLIKPFSTLDMLDVPRPTIVGTAIYCVEAVRYYPKERRYFIKLVGITTPGKIGPLFYTANFKQVGRLSGSRRAGE